MTVDSVKSQRSSKKNARSTVLSQQRRRKLLRDKSGLMNVLITFVPTVLSQKVGENSGKKEACIISVVACLRSTEQITPVMQARSKVWPRFTLLNLLDEYHYLFPWSCDHLLYPFFKALAQSVVSCSYLFKGAKPSYHPGCQKNNGPILQCAGLMLEIQLGKYSFCNKFTAT